MKLSDVAQEAFDELVRKGTDSVWLDQALSILKFAEAADAGRPFEDKTFSILDLEKLRRDIEALASRVERLGDSKFGVKLNTADFPASEQRLSVRMVGAKNRSLSPFAALPLLLRDCAKLLASEKKAWRKGKRFGNGAKANLLAGVWFSSQSWHDEEVAEILTYTAGSEEVVTAESLRMWRLRNSRLIQRAIEQIEQDNAGEARAAGEQPVPSPRPRRTKRTT